MFSAHVLVVSRGLQIRFRVKILEFSFFFAPKNLIVKHNVQLCFLSLFLFYRSHMTVNVSIPGCAGRDLRPCCCCCLGGPGGLFVCFVFVFCLFLFYFRSFGKCEDIQTTQLHSLGMDWKHGVLGLSHLLDMIYSNFFCMGVLCLCNLVTLK